MRVNAELMRRDNVSTISSYKKTIRKKTKARQNDLVLYFPKQLKCIPLNSKADSEGEYPMNKWICHPNLTTL